MTECACIWSMLAGCFPILWLEGMTSSTIQTFLTLIDMGRACLKLHASEANTNYPPQDYEGELEAAALLSAVPLSTAAAPGASEAGNSDNEDARRSELELSAMHGVLRRHGCVQHRAAVSLFSERCCNFGLEWLHGCARNLKSCCAHLFERHDPWCLIAVGCKTVQAYGTVFNMVCPAALASISSDEAESFDSKEEASAAEHRHARTAPEGVARRVSNPTPEVWNCRVNTLFWSIIL